MTVFNQHCISTEQPHGSARDGHLPEFARFLGAKETLLKSPPELTAILSDLLRLFQSKLEGKGTILFSRLFVQRHCPLGRCSVLTISHTLFAAKLFLNGYRYILRQFNTERAMVILMQLFARFPCVIAALRGSITARFKRVRKSRVSPSPSDFCSFHEAGDRLVFLLDR